MTATGSVDVRAVCATLEDADRCFAISRAAAIAGFGHVFSPGRYPFPDEAIRADWMAALTDADGETYLALQDDEAVGVVSVGHGVLQTLYVLPARVWTLTENHRARRFYDRRGWRLTGRTRVAPFPPHPVDVEYAHPNTGVRPRTSGVALPLRSRSGSDPDSGVGDFRHEAVDLDDRVDRDVRPPGGGDDLVR